MGKPTKASKVTAAVAFCCLDLSFYVGIFNVLAHSREMCAGFGLAAVASGIASFSLRDRVPLRTR